MIRAKTVFLSVIMNLGLAIPASAYDPVTHKSISELSLDRTSVYQTELLWSLGIATDPVIDMEFERLRYISDTGDIRYKRIVDFILDGAELEDSGTRPFNHFFDPVFNRALEVAGFELGERSVDWALEPLILDNQDWSMRDVKERFYSGLTAESETESDISFGKGFRALGQVIHHVQDMAQPQHARNDAHLDMAYCGNEIEDCLYEPSFYEWLSLWMSEGGYSGPATAFTIPPSEPGSYPNVNFYTESHYWAHPSEYGMADYSNRNFVTADTNFVLDGQGNFTTGEFASPGVIGWQEENVDGATMAGRNGEQLSGFVRLIKAPVTDNYLGTAPETTHYTSSYSLFAQDIRDAIDAGVPPDRFDGRNFFYLNRLNFQSANRHLYQRAIGYSAGFIDHIFRGRLEIAPPTGNIYSLIDHSTINEVGGEIPEGFASIRLKLRNATPQQNSPDSIVAYDSHVIKVGKLIAVALFRPNACYTPDLRGELDENGEIANGCNLGDWLRTEQHRVVSVEIDLPDGLSATEFMDFEFDFSANPIPVNARDLSIQVIFRGEIGGDEDAFAVARKEISEPTWFGSINSTDYFGVDSEFWRTDVFIGSPEADAWGIDTPNEEEEWGVQSIESIAYFNYVSGERLTEWAPLDEHAYHRLAALAEPDEMMWIQSIAFYRSQAITRTSGFSPVVTWLEEEPQIIHVPGYGDIPRIVRRWNYTPIRNFRGIPSRTVDMNYLWVGESPTLETEGSLPIIPGVGMPQPVEWAN